MASARLRRVGGSVMLAIPPATLESLKLKAESMVEIELDPAGEALIVRPGRRRYTLAELASEHERRPETDEDRAWLDDGPAGSEAR